MKPILLFLSLCLSLILNAQNVLFNKTYDFSTFDGGMDLIQTQDENYLIAVSGKRLLKIDLLGDTLWSKSLGNFNAVSLVEQNDGSVILGGNINDSIYTGALMKIDEYGDSLWLKRYLNREGFFTKTKVSANGNIFIVGYSDIVTSDTTGTNALLLKTDSLGNLIYEKLLNIEQNNDAFLNLYVNLDESVVCVGITGSNGLLTYFNTIGDTVFTQIHPNFTSIDDVTTTLDSNFVMVGTSKTTPFTQGLIAKITPNGVLLWEKWYTRNNINYNFKRVVSFFTDLVLVGGNETDNSNPVSNGATFIVLDVNGDSLWSNKYNFLAGTSIDEMRSALVTPNQGILFCGSSRIGSNRDLWVVRVDSLDCTNFYNGCQTVDVSEDNFNRFQSYIFPNPTSDRITIDLGNIKSGNVNIEIFDLAGKKIITQNKMLTSNSFDLNVSYLTNGIYLLKLIFSNGTSDILKVSVNK